MATFLVYYRKPKARKYFYRFLPGKNPKLRHRPATQSLEAQMASFLDHISQKIHLQNEALLLL
jgi:hypothetical protein